MRTDWSREQVAMMGLRMQMDRPVMDPVWKELDRYSKWVCSTSTSTHTGQSQYVVH